MMKDFFENPGLCHIGELILLNMSKDSLEDLVNVNNSWKSIIEQPMFWLKKCGQKFQKEENFTFYYQEWIELVKTFPTTESLVWIKDHLFISESMLPPIHLACKVGNVSFVKSFLKEIKSEKEIHANKVEDKTPLDFAIESDQKEIIELLLPHAGPDVVRNYASKNHDLKEEYHTAADYLSDYYVPERVKKGNYKLSVVITDFNFTIKVKGLNEFKDSEWSWSRRIKVTESTPTREFKTVSYRDEFPQ